MRLVDPLDPAVAQDSTVCINAELVRDGLANVDRKGCKYLKSYPAAVKKVRDRFTDAKRERLGMIEFGDIEDDDE